MPTEPTMPKVPPVTDAVRLRTFAVDYRDQLDPADRECIERVAAMLAAMEAPDPEVAKLRGLVEESLFHLRVDARAEDYHNRVLAALRARASTPSPNDRAPAASGAPKHEGRSIMRINIYAEELTDKVEIVENTNEEGTFTGVRFWLQLPVTQADGQQVKGPFLHRPDDDDSSAVTFWGKRQMIPLLETRARSAQGALRQEGLGAQRQPGHRLTLRRGGSNPAPPFPRSLPRTPCHEPTKSRTSRRRAASRARPITGSRRPGCGGWAGRTSSSAPTGTPPCRRDRAQRRSRPLALANADATNPQARRAAHHALARPRRIVPRRPRVPRVEAQEPRRI
jgi:hypothetical protein